MIGTGRLAGWPLLPARAVVGFGFLVHGLAKLNRGPDKFAALLTHLHVPMPLVAAWTTVGAEILCGAALLLGAFVAFACVPLIITMLVALFTVHLQYGFSSVNTIGLTPEGPRFGPPGYEINLVYIAALVALALSAPTPYSIDAWRKARGR
jgi:putative oxidoreductase